MRRRYAKSPRTGRGRRFRGLGASPADALVGRALDAIDAAYRSKGCTPAAENLIHAGRLVGEARGRAAGGKDMAAVASAERQLDRVALDVIGEKCGLRERPFAPTRRR